MVDITHEMIQTIQEILARGNTAEIKRIKGAVAVLETRRDKKISVPVNGQG